MDLTSAVDSMASPSWAQGVEEEVDMPNHRCRVKLVSDRCDGHLLCVEIRRDVPPQLRCSEGSQLDTARDQFQRVGAARLRT